jgi:integrase
LKNRDEVRQLSTYTMAEEENFHIKSEIEEAYQTGYHFLIPSKSKERYDKTYEIFKDWLDEKGAAITEKSLLAYFVQRISKLKSPGSLWAENSMLTSTINLHDGTDISKFNKLVAFLNIPGHYSKKSNVFSRQEMNKFLLEAPNDYILMKAVMIMGIAGALRRDELHKMTVDNITDKGSMIIVTKTNIRRSCTIIDNPDEAVNFSDITSIRKYFLLRPKKTDTNTFSYAVRQGKCVNQVVGINTMGQIPQKIAEYLKLEDPKSYTGHAFRRTSATLLAGTGVDVMALKRHGGWRFS